jgi:hypothetical protein
MTKSYSSSNKSIDRKKIAFRLIGSIIVIVGGYMTIWPIVEIGLFGTSSFNSMLMFFIGWPVLFVGAGILLPGRKKKKEGEGEEGEEEHEERRLH